MNIKAVIHNRILQHLLFWCFYFLLFYLVFRAEDEETARVSFIRAAISMPYQLFFTYFQLYFLIPRFLLKRKIIPYIIFTLLFAKIAVNIAILTYRFIIIPLHTGNPPVMPWDWLYKITV